MPILNPALSKLIHLEARSLRRRLALAARTVRGAFMIVFGLLVLALAVGPALAAGLFMRGRPGMPDLANIFEPLWPLGMMFMSLLFAFSSAGEQAFAFTPAEVDFLFPAPFDRRELLVYKIAKSLAGVILFSSFMCATSLMLLHSWIAGFIGMLLMALFFRLLGLVSSLATQIAAESARTRTRRFLLAAAGLLLMIGLAQAYSRIGPAPGLQLATELRQSWGGRIVLAPFEPFARAIMAGAIFPTLLIWGSVAAAIDLGLLALVFKLDADYLEAAAASTRKMFELRQRAIKGGGAAPAAPKGAARLRLPRPGWLLGVGPIVWRQALLAARTASHVVIATALILVGFIIMFECGVFGPLGASGLFVPAVGIGLLAYLTLLFSIQLPWAFRGDLDHMDCLKSLPVPAPAIAAGEIGGAALVLVVIQLPLLLILGLAGGGSPAPVLVAAAFALPFDLMMLGAGNILFLIYPTRLAGGSAADFQHFGRNMIFMMLHMLIMIPVFGVPALAGVLASYLQGWSWTVFAGAAWLVLTLETPVMIALLAWAFDRFDAAAPVPA